MTTNNGAGGLVAKWRARAKAFEDAGDYEAMKFSQHCARELEAALQAEGGAVAGQVRLIATDGGVLFDWRQTTREDYELSAPGSEGTGARVEYRALYTAPPSDVLRRVVEALEWYANPKVYESHPLGSAFDRRDLSHIAQTALAEYAAHKALAEGVGS